MRSCVLYVVLFVGLSAQQDSHELGLKEGEVCRIEGNEVGMCKEASQCNADEKIINKYGTLKTCSWNSTVQIVCCPSTLKSEQMCTEYSNFLCGIQSAVDYVSAENMPPGSSQDSNPVAKRSPIVGGQVTQPGKIPVIAAIGYEIYGTIYWLCGGTLISRNFVLSAAHCSNYTWNYSKWVRLGDLDFDSDTDGRPQQLEIVERVVHPNYTSPTHYNDLVLFRLDRDVKFDEFVRPACLHFDIGDPSGSGLAAGWGYNQTKGYRSSKLKHVHLQFVAVQDCKQHYGIRHYIPNGIDTNTMLCAWESGMDTCNGDSGGPLLLQPTSPSCLPRLVGVTSFGPECGVTTTPGGYIRVAHFRRWIESVVWPD